MERDPRYSMKSRVKVGDTGLGASLIGGLLIATVGVLLVVNGAPEKLKKLKQSRS